MEFNLKTHLKSKYKTDKIYCRNCIYGKKTIFGIKRSI